MARKQSKSAEIPEEEMSQDVPDEEPVTFIESKPANGKPISKADAIRRALAEGLTKAEDALPFIKSNFGHDVTPGHFAASKSREMPKGEAAQEAPAAPRRGRPPGKTSGVTVSVKRGRKPKGAAAEPNQAPAAQAAPAPAPVSSGDMLDDLAAVKQLVRKLGAGQVRKIVGLFE